MNLNQILDEIDYDEDKWPHLILDEDLLRELSNVVEIGKKYSK